jgi:hypothetical protein
MSASTSQGFHQRARCFVVIAHIHATYNAEDEKTNQHQVDRTISSHYADYESGYDYQIAQAQRPYLLAC